MSVISLRRLVLLLVLAAGAGAALARWRAREATPVPENPPQWPPLSAVPPVPAVPTELQWRTANDDGSCPVGFSVKAKDSSGIYHVPGGRFYERTNPDRCYADATAAQADGYRRSKS